MSRLRDCLDKVLSGKLKLISQEDANFIIQKAASYEADGDTPIVAARAAVNEMIANTQAAGEHVIEQIAAQRPEAHQAAIDFWNRETIRKAQPLKVRPPKVEPAAMPAVTPPVVPPVAEIPAAVPPPLPAEAPPAAPPPEAAAPAERPAPYRAALQEMYAPVIPGQPEIEPEQLAEMMKSDVAKGDAASSGEGWSATDKGVRIKVDGKTKLIPWLQVARDANAYAREKAEGQATPPPLPEPLNAQAESVIGAAPAEEQPAMRAAFEEDTSPDPHEPLKDYGQNLPPEENTELLDELSKYGAFKPGATARSVMEALAADKSQPKWVRTIMGLLLKVGAAKNLGFKIVNRPDSHWSALYVQDTKEILINLGHKPVTSLAKTFAHEVLHHLTLSKLAGDEANLSSTEVVAKRALEKIFNDIKNRPEFKGAYGTTNLWEFASEVFSNEKLRQKLNSIYPENSRFSLMQLWRRFTAALGFGDEGVKVGGYLDEAMRQTMNVAGVSAGTSVSELVAPIQRAFGFVAPLARQAFTSAGTSIPQVPAAMKKIPWEKGTRNLDLGGGRHDLGTNYLRTQGVKNLVVDPFNRSEAHNARMLREANAKGVNSVTLLNVLNVIKEPEHRDAVIKQAADYAGNDKPAYFQVYEGNGSGVGKETTKGWQENRKLPDYVAEIEKHFSQVERHGVYLEARNPDPGLVARDAKVAQDAKEFPAFAPDTARLSAPLTAASEDAERHVMEHERIKSRVFDTANATYSPAERSDMNTALNTLIEKKGFKISKAEKAQLQKVIETQVRDMRAKFAASQNWMQDKIKPIGIEELKQNKKTGEWMVKTEFKGIDYTFDRDTEGNFYQRDTPEWEGRVEDMAEKGSEEIMNLVNQGGKVANTIMEQKGWYREMTAYLRNVFGGMSDLMADFLGTFSPRTDMEHTWIYSMQALQKLVRGDYDELMAEFDAHIRGGGTPEQWKDAGKPMIMRPGAEKGKEALFGVNSIHGMVAMLDMWRRIDKGSSPKARNFTANLIGLSMKATIDMWAARFLQRMAHPNQRVPTTMEGGVEGKHMANIELVDKGFGLGQDVFDRMVEKLKAKDPERFSDMTSPDLQAVLWFVEKEIWEKEGWTAVRGAANSARALAAAEGVRRFVAGVPNERPDSLVNVSHNMAQGLELQNELHKDEKVIGAKVQDTHAIHNGERQRSFDAEWLAHAEYNPEKTVKDLARMAHTLDRDGTYISRIIHDDDEVNPNATNGLTIFLKKQATPEDLKGMEAKLKKLGIDNAVLQVDPRVKPGELGPDRYNGVRIQFLPEFGKATEAKFTKTLAKVRSAFASDPSVAVVDTVRYDTLTLKKGEYDATGELTSAAARERRAAWTERSRIAGAKAADIRNRAKAVITASREEAKRIKRESKKLEAAEDAARLAALSGGVQGEGEAGVTSAPLAPHGAEWFGDSKVVNPDGTPMVMYHGSAKVFDEFKGRWGNYFSSNKKYAAGFGERGVEMGRGTKPQLYETYLSIQNPLELDGDHPESWERYTQYGLDREELIKQGYDGVIMRYADGEVEAMTFHPEQAHPVAEESPLKRRFSAPLAPRALSPEPDSVRKLGEDVLGRQVASSMPLQIVDGGVLSALKNDKVKTAIVPFVPTDVVNILRAADATPEDFFRNPDVVLSNVPVDRRGEVGRGIVGAIREAGTSIRTKLRGLEPGGNNLEILPALLAGDLNRREVAGLLSPERMFHGESGLRPEEAAATFAGAEPLTIEDRGVGAGNVSATELARLLDAHAEIIEPDKGIVKQIGAVAPLAPTAEEQPTQDSTDVVSAPLSPMGKLSRFFFGGPTTAAAGAYKAGGLFSAGGNFTKKIYQAILKGQQNGRATIRRAEYLVNKLNSAMVANYGKDWAQTITEAHRRLLNTALGNVDNRLTEAQSKTANRLIDRAAQTSYKQKVAYAQTIGDPEVRAAYIAKARADYDAANEQARDAYRTKARSDNVNTFRIAQSNALASLPPELRDIVVQMNDVVTDLSISMMWLRGKGGVATNMRAAIAENIGTYLHRSYDIFDDNRKWLEFIKGTDPRAQQIVANAKVVFERDLIAREARRFAKEQRDAGTPVTRPQAIAHATSVITADDVESMLSDYLRAGDKDPFTRRISLMGGEIPGKAGTAIVTERGQIPREIRELWGEQHDIATNFHNTYLPMARFLEKKSFQDFLLSDGIKEGYVWKEGVSLGATHPPDFVPLKPSGAQTMGLLDGVYVVPELADAYKAMTTQEVMNQTDTWIKQLVGYTLVAKTRLSLVSTERNLLGNILINMANGNFFRNPAEMTKALYASGHIIKSEMSTEKGFRWLGQTSEETQKMIERGTELGVFGESVNANVLSKVVDTMKKSKGDFTNMDIATLRPLRENIARFTGKTYTLADDAAKMYSWQSEMEKLRWAYEGQNVSEAQIEEEAAQIVRQTTPTYSEAWMGSKWFSGGVGKYVAPFIMFKLEMIRSTLGIAQQAFTEMKSPNPRIKGLGVVRLGSLLVTTLLVPAAAASLTKWLWDYDDDDEEALRRSLPDYQRNNMLLFGPKMNGKPSYIDLGFMNPYSALPTGTPLLSALRAYHETQDPEEGAINFLVAGLREFLTPFTSEQLLFQGIEDVYRNQDSRRNKQQLYNPQAPLNERYGIIVDRLWHTVTPGTLDSLERVARGIAGQETPSGRAYDWRAEASSMIAGTKWQVYDPAQGLQSQTAGFESQKKDAGNLFNQPFTIRGTIRPGDVYNGYNHANAARKRLFYDMRQKFLGSISLGMTRAQAIRAMEIGYGTEIRAAGLGNADMAQILNGKYYKYVPSTPAINDAYRNHPERYLEFQRAFREAPTVEDISK